MGLCMSGLSAASSIYDFRAIYDVQHNEEAQAFANGNSSDKFFSAALFTQSAMLFTAVFSFAFVVGLVARTVRGAGLELSQFRRVWVSTIFIMTTFTFRAVMSLIIALGSLTHGSESAATVAGANSIRIYLVKHFWIQYLIILFADAISGLVGVWGLGGCF